MIHPCLALLKPSRDRRNLPAAGQCRKGAGYAEMHKGGWKNAAPSSREENDEGAA
jgi:hypothetical protein